MVILILAALAGVSYYLLAPPLHELVLTGIVTTDEVIVSPEIQGRVGALVRQGRRHGHQRRIAGADPAPELAGGRGVFTPAASSSPPPTSAQAQADLENARLNFERIEGFTATTSSRCRPTTRRGRLTIPPRRGSNPLNSQIQAAARAEGKGAGATGLHRNPRAHRRHRGHARRVAGRGGQSRPGHRHADQSRTIFGCAPTWRRPTSTGSTWATS